MIRWLDIHRRRIFAFTLFVVVIIVAVWGGKIGWAFHTAYQDNYNALMRTYINKGQYQDALEWARNRPEAVEYLNEAMEIIRSKKVSEYPDAQTSLSRSRYRGYVPSLIWMAHLYRHGLGVKKIPSAVDGNLFIARLYGYLPGFFYQEYFLNEADLKLEIPTFIKKMIPEFKKNPVRADRSDDEVKAEVIEYRKKLSAFLYILHKKSLELNDPYTQLMLPTLKFTLTDEDKAYLPELSNFYSNIMSLGLEESQRNCRTKSSKTATYMDLWRNGISCTRLAGLPRILPLWAAERYLDCLESDKYRSYVNEEFRILSKFCMEDRKR
jgi:hypothetical protein